MKPKAKVLDEAGNDLGYGLEIYKIHQIPNLLCEVCHVWIYDPKGWVLLQQRSQAHASDPGKWDISAAGHIDFGETALEAAKREVREELGMEIDPTKFELASRKYIEHKAISNHPKIPKEYLHNEYINFYFLKLDKSNSEIKLVDGEVGAFKWLKLSDFQRNLHDPNLKQSFVRFDDSYYDFVISELKKRISKNWGEL